MSQSIKGKTAIVTGAGSGINLAFAQQLLARDCNVVIADLGLRPEAKELVDSHSSSSSGKGRAVFQQTDVTNWEHLERMFETAEREFGEVDIVCPGAGVYEPVRDSYPFERAAMMPGNGIGVSIMVKLTDLYISRSAASGTLLGHPKAVIKSAEGDTRSSTST